MRTPRVLALGMTVLVLLGACTTGGGATPTRRPRSPPRGSPEHGRQRSRRRRPRRPRSRSARTTSTSRSSWARSMPRPSRTPATRSSASSASARARSGSRRWTPARSTWSPSTSARASASTTRPRSPATARRTPTRSRRRSTPEGEHHGPRHRARPGHERVRRPPGHGVEQSLAKMSDLAAHQDELKWGLPADCDTNPLCAGALKDYGINYPPKQRTALGACDVPMAQALQGKAIDVAEFCSTQPAIAQFGFVVLEDDKKTQPAENIAPLVRNDYLAKVDEPPSRRCSTPSRRRSRPTLDPDGRGRRRQPEGRQRGRRGVPDGPGDDP